MENLQRQIYKDKLTMTINFDVRAYLKTCRLSTWNYGLSLKHISIAHHRLARAHPIYTEVIIYFDVGFFNSLFFFYLLPGRLRYRQTVFSIGPEKAKFVNRVVIDISRWYRYLGLSHMPQKALWVILWVSNYFHRKQRATINILSGQTSPYNQPTKSRHLTPWVI